MAKTSISIDAADLKWLRAWARKHHEGNLSAAVAEGMRALQPVDRMRSLVDYRGAPQLTDADRARRSGARRAATRAGEALEARSVRGILTSDPDDLERLAVWFGGVRVLAV